MKTAGIQIRLSREINWNKIILFFNIKSSFITILINIRIETKWNQMDTALVNFDLRDQIEMI